jgi:hypothetical protein
MTNSASSAAAGAGAKLVPVKLDAKDDAVWADCRGYGKLILFGEHFVVYKKPVSYVAFIGRLFWSCAHQPAKWCKSLQRVESAFCTASPASPMSILKN